MRYTSALRLFGVPLVDIRVGGRAGGRGTARGWIAIGDIAVGYLFAFGGLAIAPFAAGGLTAGFVTFGGLAAGGFAIGGAALGAWSIGGVAVAWQAALGGLAVAAQYALGGAAFAPHANDAAAKTFFAALPFSTVRGVLQHARWLLLLTVLGLLALRARRGDSVA